tara:strand:- start:2276 stop:3232 length:957 start_codon:yes stop_codon:yes gene_type:complete
MFYKDKKIAVAGGSGMVGSHLIKALLERGALVRTNTFSRNLNFHHDNLEVIDNLDLESADNCNSFLKDQEIVFNVAGQIAHPAKVSTDFQIALNQVTITTNLCEASLINDLSGYCDLNSSTGYPDIRKPIPEEEFWKDEPYISYYGYGWSRRYREKIMEHLSHLSDIKISICRGTAMFGPGDNFNPETSHVIPALISRILSGENPLKVWGSPDVVRDFLYVKDVVKGMLLVVEKGESMEPYNLGYGSTVTIGELVKNIVEASGLDIDYTFDETKPTTIPFRMVDTAKIKNNIGFDPSYTLLEGLKETITWYKENRLDN